MRLEEGHGTAVPLLTNRACAEVLWHLTKPPFLFILEKCGAVAQLGERFNRTEEVRGSNPLSSIG